MEYKSASSYWKQFPVVYSYQNVNIMYELHHLQTNKLFHIDGDFD